MSNLLEYALRTNPRVANSHPQAVCSFNGSGQLVMSYGIREGVRGMTATAEISSVLPFGSAHNAAGVVTDSAPGDGAATLTFTDNLSRQSTTSRFVRFKFVIAE